MSKMAISIVLGLALLTAAASNLDAAFGPAPPDVAWSFSTVIAPNGYSLVYRLASFSPPEANLAPIGALNPTIPLVVGNRYAVTVTDAARHSFQLIAKGPTLVNDTVLLSQGASVQGPFETDPDVAWVDEAATVTFTLTPELAAAMTDPNAGQAPGYRSRSFTFSQRGDFAIFGPSLGGPFGPSPVYRFWSPVDSRHFYTISENEKNAIVAAPSATAWTYETVAYYAFYSNSEPGLAPVYRFRSPLYAVYFYTISEAEKDSILASYVPTVWSYEGPAFYAYPEGSQPVGTSPVHRFRSSATGAEFYTIDAAERDYIIANLPAWQHEGIAWYAHEP